MIMDPGINCLPIGHRRLCRACCGCCGALAELWQIYLKFVTTSRDIHSIFRSREHTYNTTQAPHAIIRPPRRSRRRYGGDCGNSRVLLLLFIDVGTWARDVAGGRRIVRENSLSFEATAVHVRTFIYSLGAKPLVSLQVPRYISCTQWRANRGGTSPFLLSHVTISLLLLSILHTELIGELEGHSHGTHRTKKALSANTLLTR